MGDPSSLFFLYIISGIIVGSFTSTLAKAKGYSEVMWGLGGFFFSFAALITMVGMPIKQSTAAKT